MPGGGCFHSVTFQLLVGILENKRPALLLAGRGAGRETIYYFKLSLQAVLIIGQVKIEQACHFAVIFFQKRKEAVLFVKGYGGTVGIHRDETATRLVVEDEEGFDEVYQE